MTPYRSALLVTSLLAVSAVAGFYGYRWWMQASIGAPTAAFAPPLQRPAFELPDPAGVLHSSTQWHDQALVVNFWATWCRPCRQEIPLLMELHERHAAAGLQVLGIALDDPEEVAAYAAEMGINYPILVGEQAALDLATAFGIEAAAMVLPFTVFTTADGAVVGRHIGELHRAEAEQAFRILAQTRGEALSSREAERQIRAALRR